MNGHLSVISVKDIKKVKCIFTVKGKKKYDFYVENRLEFEKRILLLETQKGSII